MEKLISVCIPVYEMGSAGIKMLSNLIQSVKNQTYKNVQIVISDHSKDKIFKEYEKDSQIKYCEFNEKYGNGPANTNNVIKNADGEIIKPMFQDDFFVDNNSLKIMVDALENSDKNWIGCKCTHTDEVGEKRYYDHDAQWGGMDDNKTISSYVSNGQGIGGPSVIMYKKNNLQFDENLVMLMDYAFYFKLGQIYGDPLLLNEKPLIVVRIWPGTISNKVGSGVVRKEKDYLLKTYQTKVISL